MLTMVHQQQTAQMTMSIQKQLTSVQHLTFFSDGYRILRQKKR